MTLHTLTKTPAFVTFALTLAVASLTACGDKTENPPVANNATNPAEKDVPMSAKPAEGKAQPIAVDEETKADKGSKGVTVASGTAMTMNEPTSATGHNEKVIAVTADSHTDSTAEGTADNSGMDKISENDQVIDETPASPDAPKAQEEKSQISNAPTGHKKK